MDNTIHYTASHKMSDLAANHYKILLILSRFGIGLGFGDKTIEEVCHDNNVDTSTFLTITNIVLSPHEVGSDDSINVSPQSLISYLQRSHCYFLDFRLPAIRRKMLEALIEKQPTLNEAVVRYFDEYAEEVRKHMMYEEKKVFPYINSLLNGKVDGRYSIDVFHRHHDQIELRLKEFKQILIKYYPSEGSNELNSVLFDIFNCEHDLASHNEVENRLLIPAIRNLEQQNQHSINQPSGK